MYLPLLPIVIWRINICQIALATCRLEARAFCTVDLLAENCLLLLLCIYKNFRNFSAKRFNLVRRSTVLSLSLLEQTYLRRPRHFLEAVLPVPDDLAPMSRQEVVPAMLVRNITGAEAAACLKERIYKT
jgi:hypothetical protein